MMILLYFLAIIGAALGTFGDVCGTEAARRGGLTLYDFAGALAWTCCYPVFRAMCSLTGGSFAKPAASWTVCGAVFSVIVALKYAEPETPARRAFFVALVACAVAREVV